MPLPFQRGFGYKKRAETVPANHRPGPDHTAIGARHGCSQLHPPKPGIYPEPT